MGGGSGFERSDFGTEDVMRRQAVARLICLTALALFVQLSCAGCGGGGLYVKCWLEDTATGKKVPARFEISDLSGTASGTCIDRKGDGCVLGVNARADYEVSCQPLGAYKIIGSGRQNAFPGSSLIFYCTELPL